MRRKSCLFRSPALGSVGILAGSLFSLTSLAADAPPEAWPDRPVPEPPQVVGPSAPGDALALPPQTPDAVLATPLQPTQSVPTGVRELRGPAVTVAPKDSPFEVNAPDMASAYRVQELCDRLKPLVGRFLTWPEKPVHIQIQLIPAARADFAGPYVIKPGDNGAPTALVRWSADTAFFDVCQALCTATLQNIVYVKDGNAAGRVPDWLRLGLAAWLEAAIKPAMMDEYADQARRVPMLAMRQIMSAQAPAGEDVRILTVNAFWLMMFLNDESGNPSVAHALFDALAVGINPAPLLGTAFPGKFDDPRALELWWQVGFRDELARHLPPFQPIDQTRALLDELATVQIVRANIPQRVALDEAWDGHADKNVRDIVEKTLLSARYTPNRANPVYKNALVSLMIALQQFHDGDKKAFDFAWKQYQADRANGEAIESTVKAAMEKEPAK